MKGSATDSTAEQTSSEMSDDLQSGRKPYARPEILSTEALEAVAAVCEPPGFPTPPTFGKGGPPGCVNAQS